MTDSYRVIPLRAFLHKTLGGFADPPPPRPDEIMARRYAEGEKVEAILADQRFRDGALYRALRRYRVPLRTAC